MMLQLFIMMFNSKKAQEEGGFSTAVSWIVKIILFIAALVVFGWLIAKVFMPNPEAVTSNVTSVLSKIRSIG